MNKIGKEGIFFLEYGKTETTVSDILWKSKFPCFLHPIQPSRHRIENYKIASISRSRK